jgi:hypothetical protein
MFFGHFVYFTAKWYIFGPFGASCGHLVYFSPFCYVVPRKIWQPCSQVIIGGMFFQIKGPWAKIKIPAHKKVDSNLLPEKNYP